MSSDVSLSPQPVPTDPPEAATFGGLLFEGQETTAQDPPEPACFRDLNLDQLVASVIAGRDEYGLAPYFRSPVTSVETIRYRHEVLRDLEKPGVGEAVSAFAAGMAATRRQLAAAARFHYPVQQQETRLGAATTYVSTLRQFAAALAGGSPTSRALTSFGRFLREHVSSAGFEALAEEAAAVRTGLDRVQYRLHAVGDRVHVSRVVAEGDYTADVTGTFARFRQGAVESRLSTIPSYAELNHVEAAVADLVAALFPDEFTALAGFSERHGRFLDGCIERVDRELQFYVAYLQFARRLRAGGLPMCCPQVSASGTPISGSDVYDPALADRLTRQNTPEDTPMVCNDFALQEGERILVVTGPNQGGKTTFARTVAQMTYLASLGLLVPGRQAHLSLPDRIFTHFERGENLQDLTGALADDLVRIRAILDAATGDSLIVVNEIFTSTSLDDAVTLSTRVLREVVRLGCLCVCVTFLDELASVGGGTVSLVSQVDPNDPARRTFKVVRQPADGAAYSQAIARKYRLDGAHLTARLAR